MGEEEKKKEEDMREQGSGANVLALKKDLEKLETMKKNAIMKEDYDSAKSLKKKIKEKKKELRIATQKTTSQGSDANVVVLKKDLEKLEMMKKNAIIKEDYDSAKSLKKEEEKKKEEDMREQIKAFCSTHSLSTNDRTWDLCNIQLEDIDCVTIGNILKTNTT